MESNGISKDMLASLAKQLETNNVAESAAKKEVTKKVEKKQTEKTVKKEKVEKVEKVKKEESIDKKDTSKVASLDDLANEKEKITYKLNVDYAIEMAKIMQIEKKFSANIISMISEGLTIPFIARYRKSLTNNMDDQKLREFEKEYAKFQNLVAKKEQVLSSLQNRDILTDELLSQIVRAQTVTEVDNLYKPYKLGKKTRATTAIANGLLPLYESMILLKENEENHKKLLELAQEYVTDELSLDDCIQGAKDIFAEKISDNIQVREIVLDGYKKYGKITSTLAKNADDPKFVYKNYYEFEQDIKSVPSHRYLAITRGEKEDVLSISLVCDDEKIMERIQQYLIKKIYKFECLFMNECIKDGYKRLLLPSVVREIRAELKEKADNDAIGIFGSNLKELLLQSPLKNVRILGYDPGFVNGSKLATIDANGNFIQGDVIYVTMNEKNKDKGIQRLKELIVNDKIDVVAIGNGTASFESEQIVAQVIKDMDTKYIVISESGASVYSASTLAAEEFPNVNVSIRGAISIARRLQDPLSELVKIDPKSIGVGQYQHDVDQKGLDQKLDSVVEDVVNAVGVDLNTAGIALLTHISGLTKQKAKKIVEYREKNGSFKNRKQLLDVPTIGPKVYDLAAGFCRIYNGDNPIECTSIHPESYDAAKLICKKYDINLLNLIDNDKKEKEIEKISKISLDEILQDPDFGKYDKYTIQDILLELQRPGIDIRQNMPGPILKDKALTFESIQVGDIYKGTVRNIAAFGAFVDIGAHGDGLVHISQISSQYVKDPMSILKVGQIVEVMVIEKDEQRHKISLSIKEAELAKKKKA